MRTYFTVLDKNAKLLFVDNELLRFSGMDPENVIGRPVWESPWFDHDEVVRNDVLEACTNALLGHIVHRETLVRIRHEPERLTNATTLLRRPAYPRCVIPRQSARTGIERWQGIIAAFGKPRGVNPAKQWLQLPPCPGAIPFR